MDNEYIEKLLPEVREVRDDGLRRAVIKAWQLAMEKGKWQSIDDVPFTLLTEAKTTLVEHTRAVTRMAVAIADSRQDLDRDILVAGGLVHDVGKLLEYCRSGDGIVKSEYGKRVRHPVSGFGVALEAGLPLEVAHIVAAHSKEGEGVARSPEAIVIHHCDFIDFDIAKSQ
ncbi:MAG: HD domain-containing protein [candidate division WOR-3 bacterium]|nr:MAG: HD domain-containing protein [candidate division WOR-3 bacterium]